VGLLEPIHGSATVVTTPAAVATRETVIALNKAKASATATRWKFRARAKARVLVMTLVSHFVPTQRVRPKVINAETLYLLHDFSISTWNPQITLPAARG
jgi:hypothetical protein